MTAYDVDGARVLSARRREELLDKLVQVFLTHGFAAYDLDDLALRCHCSPETLRVLDTDAAQLRRTVIGHFFRRCAVTVERRVAAVSDPQHRPGEYLAAVSEVLGPATNAFFRDLERFPAGRQMYEVSTRRAAQRVGELLRDAVRAGRLRDVQASFVGDAVGAVTARICSGALLMSTGLDDARAYSELAALVAGGLAAS